MYRRSTPGQLSFENFYLPFGGKLEVVCTQEQGQNLIRVTDNGSGVEVTSGCSGFEGQGTKQAKSLARQLGGTFRRSPIAPKGTVCELVWPVAKGWL